MRYPGSLNPADIPSRGVDICKDEFLELWLNGPEFLVYSKDMWPPQDNMCHSANLIAEELVNKGKTEEKLSNVISLKRFIDYDKVIRVLCYVRRFIYNCKAIVRKENCLTGNTSFKEFREAELLLLQEDQLLFKGRKYEFIDSFNSFYLIVMVY